MSLDVTIFTSVTLQKNIPKQVMKLSYIINILLATFYCFISNASYGQREKIDSMEKLLKSEKSDSNKVGTLWHLAEAYQVYKPDTSLKLAQQAVVLARKIKYIEGESRALNQVANAFNQVGNYPRALDFYLQKLKLEERRNNPENLAIAYMNIGTVYHHQQEYRKAIDYALTSDSIISRHRLNRLRMYALLNLGDAYEKYNKLDSAMETTNDAYEAATQMADENMMGATLNNLANICLKHGTLDLALKNYRKAIPFLIKTQDEDVECETTIGLAKTFSKLGETDSALYYAKRSFSLSWQDGFLSRNLEASTFLKNYYESVKNIDSAYKYQQEMMNVINVIDSKERIREAQSITMNEEDRQKELNDLKLREKEELKERLQYIGIGVVLPFLFLITFYLANKKVKPKYVEYLGIVSLLLFFEYITLLLHPRVAEIAHHVPLFELIVLSSVAVVLTRLHHRVEHWFLARLSGKKH
jgi:tetratricopeptide (TPR) repeat protein